MSLVVKVVFLACVVLVVAANPLTEDERKAMVMDLIGKCKAKEGVSDSEVQDAIAHAPPKSREAQCFHACVMETLGILVDSKISLEGSIKLAEMTGDPVKVKNSEAVANACLSIGGGDRCDSALLIMQCVAETSAKLGIDPIKDLH